MAKLTFAEQARQFKARYGSRAIEVAARTRNIAKTPESKRHWDKVIRALEIAPWRGRERNPDRASDYAKVANLYEQFTGHAAEPFATTRAPTIPKVAAVIGTLDFVGYTTVRDGQREKYIHKFRASDKPLLCASPDGKVFLLGGNYDFTERGIVDKSDPT